MLSPVNRGFTSEPVLKKLKKIIFMDMQKPETQKIHD